MKRLYTILSLIICTMSVDAQNNVFVLVDVSKSVTQADLNNAKQALTEIFTGYPLSVGNIKGPASDLSKFKLNVGDKLSVSRFGSCLTTWAITPSLNGINNLNTDVTSTLNSISWSPTDNNTFILLAKAKIAEFAVRNRITNYKLIIITDNIQTDFAKGKLNYCNNDAKDLAESYKSGNNPVIEGVYTLLKFSPSADFTIHLIQSVDVSKYNPGGGIVPPPDTIQTPPTITLTSFTDGKKGKPKPTGSNSFTISWTCNPPQNIKYNVMLTEVGGKFKDLSKKNIQGNSVKYNDIPSGKFKIVVSALGVNSATTIIETPSSDYGWLIFILILIAGIGIGYYFWNKKRQEKIDAFATNKGDDIFSKSSGGTTSSNSSNSDYF